MTLRRLLNWSRFHGRSRPERGDSRRQRGHDRAIVRHPRLDSGGVITSLRNPRVAAARKLRRSRVRRETGRTTIEGPFLLEEAIRAGVAVQEVFCLADDEPALELCAANGIDENVVAGEVMNGLAETAQPRGPVAVIAIPVAGPIRPVDSIVLWGVADPGNAGTIIRTAAAFGFQVVATVGSVDLWSPKVVRSAVGSHFRVGPIEGAAADPEMLSSSGLRLVAMAADGEVSLRAAAADEASLGFIVGNEAHGVPASVRQHPAVTTAAIPMPGGTESLNAAVTAAIVMYERMHTARA